MTESLTRPGLVRVVAVDGPAGSGKSSVSRAVASRLGYGYLDTGAVYRALAWHALAHAVDTSDASAVVDASGDFDLWISLDPAEAHVSVAGTDVTEAIRTSRVTEAVSGVARVPAVRRGLTGLFRALVAGAGRPGVVVEGRDITTIVFPDAEARVLLTADPAVRAARRTAETEGADVAVVAASIERRDAADSAVVEFMDAADGVRVVDSTHLDFEGTVDAVLAVIAEETGAAQEVHDVV
ncbi:MAG: cytidylate kinase [Microbacterium sp.]|uniref:(d)CMP kinase n=1 Tax=uncultured Microbacterium sp. TaxID=191216 RepID=UPI000C980FA7|nr:(d)CMP kinase [uncultured Microbacterium sp.]MAL06310.1 cytidylate kinase [Microbacterium sp.]